MCFQRVDDLCDLGDDEAKVCSDPVPTALHHPVSGALDRQMLSGRSRGDSSHPPSARRGECEWGEWGFPAGLVEPHPQEVEES